MNYSINNLINQQKLNEINANEAKLAQERKAREKELEKEIFEMFKISPILKNLPRPVDIFKEKGNLARKSLFFINEKSKKFVYLTKKAFLYIDPKPSCNSIFARSYWQEEEI